MVTADEVVGLAARLIETFQASRPNRNANDIDYYNAVVGNIVVAYINGSAKPDPAEKETKPQ